MPRAFLIKKKSVVPGSSPRTTSPKPMFSPSSSGIGSPDSSNVSNASSSPRNDENRFEMSSPRYSFKKDDNQGLDLSMKSLLKEANFTEKSPKRDYASTFAPIYHGEANNFVSSYPYPAKFAKIADFLRNGSDAAKSPGTYQPADLILKSAKPTQPSPSQSKPLNFSTSESYRLPPYSINWSEHFSVNKLISPTPSSQASDDSGRGSVHSEEIDKSDSAKKYSKKSERYQCPDCNKSYSTQSGLAKHQEFLCTTQVKKSFSCKHCDKVYVSLGALKMHIRTHTLPCKCKLCGKAFSRPWLLQGHIRTHTGEKPFACQFCNRAFADRSNLRAHLQTHSVVKKYSCKTCSRTFSRMSLLLKHEDNGCTGSRMTLPATAEMIQV